MDDHDHAAARKRSRHGEGTDRPWVANLITHSTNTRLATIWNWCVVIKPPIVITALGSPEPAAGRATTTVAGVRGCRELESRAKLLRRASTALRAFQPARAVTPVMSAPSRSSPPCVSSSTAGSWSAVALPTGRHCRRDRCRRRLRVHGHAIPAIASRAAPCSSTSRWSSIVARTTWSSVRDGNCGVVAGAESAGRGWIRALRRVAARNYDTGRRRL